MGRIKSKLVPKMVPNGSNQVQIGPNESKCIQICPDWSKLVHIGKNGSKWVQIGPNGAKWVQMCPNGYTNCYEQLQIATQISKQLQIGQYWTKLDKGQKDILDIKKIKLHFTYYFTYYFTSLITSLHLLLPLSFNLFCTEINQLNILWRWLWLWLSSKGCSEVM